MFTKMDNVNKNKITKTNHDNIYPLTEINQDIFVHEDGECTNMTNFTTDSLFDTVNDVINDDNDEDDDDLEDEELNKWQYKYNDFKIVITKEDPVDELLLKIFKEENRHIERVINQLTKSGTLSDIVNLFVAPLIPVIISAVNSSASNNDHTIETDEAIHFVRCIMALSIYKQSPSLFFDNMDMFPLAATLDKKKFNKVLNGLNRKRQSIFEDSEIRWDRPFSEDPCIRDGEDAITKINRQFFIPDVSILSIDDDHLRLSSDLCEQIGMPRKNNPDKAFGPVSTGVISLTSGITIGNRIAGRGENDEKTVTILFLNIFNKKLADQIKCTNLIALDRGYLSAKMIEFLSTKGCSIIGTHKRGLTYPFTFGNQQRTDNRVKIEEIGCKMTYWARYKNQEIDKTYKALAYRSGRGRVATIFVTSPEVNEGKFIYRLKKDCSIPKIPRLIRNHMNHTVTELTLFLKTKVNDSDEYTTSSENETEEIIKESSAITNNREKLLAISPKQEARRSIVFSPKQLARRGEDWDINNLSELNEEQSTFINVNESDESGKILTTVKKSNKRKSIPPKRLERPLWSELTNNEIVNIRKPLTRSQK